MEWISGGTVFYILAVNGITFLAFGIDKYKAVHHRFRIREATLFTLALLGGAAGGLAGMHCFHHKTRKPAFAAGMPLILALQFIGAAFCFK